MSQQAAYVLNKARQKDVAVFLINGRLKTMFPAGARFDLMLSDFPNRLVGVYNELVTEKMIEDDLSCFRE